MDTDRMDDLERRVVALEAALEAWRSRTRQLLQRRYGVDRESGTTAGSRTESAPRVSWRPVVDAVTGEGAIGRIGIGLLLLGLVYAVQYGIDRGWITELVQVLLATVTGVTLLGLGQWTSTRRPVLSRLLTGGGFGALYVAVFAAQAVYQLIPFGPALALMSIVTAGCFLVGVSRGDAAMAVVAVLGGLVTPFVIESGEAELPALVAYVSVVLAAAGLLYWRRGWRSLLAWSSLAALPVIILILVFLQEPEVIPLAWRWSVQGGLLVGVLIFSVIPLARTSFPGLSPAPAAPDWIRPVVPRILAPVIAAVVALSAWGMERAVWNLETLSWAAIAVPVVVLVTAAYRSLSTRGKADESLAVLFVLAWLVSILFVDLFDSGGLSIAGWSLVVLALVASHRRKGTPGALATAGTLVVVQFFWMRERLAAEAGEHLPFLTWDAAGDALAVILLGFSAREIVRRDVRIVAGVAVWIAALALMGREFTEASTLTIAWSVSAILLLAAGRYGRSMRLMGMATVALVVAKLLLFDLASVDGLVRVGIFAGFGTALLVVSYLFPSWWRGAEKAAASDGESAEVP